MCHGTSMLIYKKYACMIAHMRLCMEGPLLQKHMEEYTYVFKKQAYMRMLMHVHRHNNALIHRLMYVNIYTYIYIYAYVHICIVIHTFV